MIQAESALGHHFFEVPIADRIAEIPTKAQDDDLVLKVSFLKVPAPSFSLVYPTEVHSSRLRQSRSDGFPREMLSVTSNSSPDPRPALPDFKGFDPRQIFPAGASRV